jgi:hypothetical protein
MAFVEPIRGDSNRRRHGHDGERRIRRDRRDVREHDRRSHVHCRGFTTYTACDFTITGTTTNWTVSTNYGRPAPFIQFVAPGGTTTVGEVLVTASRATFRFLSVDVYSSTTPIPYVITGIASSATVFTIRNTQPNTFGNFATLVNPEAATQVDALVIRLSNPAAPCCSNPMGLDNIVLAR